MRISEQIEVGRRQQHVLARVSRAAWRLDQAERERRWALASAYAEGSRYAPWPRRLGCQRRGCTSSSSPPTSTCWTRRSVTCEPRGWPVPEDPDSGEDAELDGRDTIADRLSDEVDWLRRCADWLAQLDTGGYPPAVNLRPARDWPNTAHIAVDLARVGAVLHRIAADLDELARARRVAGRPSQGPGGRTARSRTRWGNGPVTSLAADRYPELGDGQGRHGDAVAVLGLAEDLKRPGRQAIGADQVPVEGVAVGEDPSPGAESAV
ncbi:MAG: hypothetical protein ACXV3F_08235 [Frankiaceae bacterium]